MIVLMLGVVEVVVFEEGDEEDDEGFGEMRRFWGRWKRWVFKLFL